MKYYPDVHHRRSIRLKAYDYSQPGAYFITICTDNKELYFEQYPQLKQLVNRQWHEITSRFDNIQQDEFIIMPNHIHGIIFVGATLAVAQNIGQVQVLHLQLPQIIGRVQDRPYNW